MNIETLPPEISDFIEDNSLRAKNISYAIYTCIFAVAIFIGLFSSYRIVGTMVGIFLLFFTYLILRYLPKKQVVQSNFTLDQKSYQILSSLEQDLDNRTRKQKKVFVVVLVIILLLVALALYNLYTSNITRMCLYFAVALALLGFLVSRYFLLKEKLKMYQNLLSYAKVSNKGK